VWFVRKLLACFLVLGVLAVVLLYWTDPFARAPAPVRTSLDRDEVAALPGGGSVDATLAWSDAVSAPDDSEQPEPLRGRVVSANAGVAGARVWVVADTRPIKNAPAAVGPVLAETTTEDDGTFSFKVASGRPYVVYAQADLALGATLLEADDRFCRVRLPGHPRRRQYRIVDVEGNPVPGVTVQVLTGRRSVITLDAAVSASDGTVTLAISDRADLFLTAPGIATQKTEARRESDTIVVEIGAPIAGVVVDGEGKPRPNLIVALWRPHQFDDLCLSGPDGRFRFEGTPLEAQAVNVFRSGERVLSASIEPGDERARLVLLDPVSRAGVVEFPDGRPAVGAIVGNHRADAEGRFVFKGLPQSLVAKIGTLPALPGAAASPRWTGQASWPDDSHELIRIVLEEQSLSFVRMRFLDTANRPVQGVRFGSLPCQISDAEGRAVTSLAAEPGTVRVLQPTAGGFPFRFEATTFATLDETPEQVVRVPAPARATVIARLPNGDPLPPNLTAQIELMFAKVVSAERDRALFEFDRLSGYGRFHVRLRLPGYLGTSRAISLPEEDGAVEVRVARGVEVTGRLIDQMGSPARGWTMGGGVSVEIGEDGRFRMASVAPGDVHFTFGVQANRTALAIDRRIEGERVNLGDIRLLPPRVLRGRVVGNGPLAGAVVRFAHRRHEVATATRSDGSFRLRVLPGLDAKLQISKPGWGGTVVDAKPDQVVRVHRGGSVRIVVRRDDAPNPRVMSYSFGVRLPGTSTRLPARQEQSRFFTDVPAGPIEVYVETIRGIRSVIVQVEPDRTVIAELTIP